MDILALNCGSSSVKYQLYDWKKKEVIAKGMVERVTGEPERSQHARAGLGCRDQLGQALIVVTLGEGLEGGVDLVHLAREHDLAGELARVLREILDRLRLDQDRRPGDGCVESVGWCQFIRARIVTSPVILRRPGERKKS